MQILGTSNRRFAVLVLVLIVSFFFAYVSPGQSLIKGLITLPGIAALCGAIWQVLHEEMDFNRKRILEQNQEAFSIGATSHMANVAFDKHADFCEKYMKEVYNLMDTLFREGDTPEALNHANCFLALRREYAAWICSEISLALDPFEDAVRKGGALARYIEATRVTNDRKQAVRRDEAIAESAKILYNILGMVDEDTPVNPELAAEQVMEKLRIILGIQELTKIRQILVKNAMKTMSNA